ncbi:hypothetical protein [Paracoccus cavernae]|uniref:hypothetical protein n=1 Tax=Paracoccus cavernae TaxID=1571207 RepID=UPI0035F2B89B
MKWAECAALSESLGHSRFLWPSGGITEFNCEPGFTLSDLTGAISWIWTYPGDFILRVPSIASFLEVPSASIGGLLSSAITFGLFALIWFTVTLSKPPRLEGID